MNSTTHLGWKTIVNGLRNEEQEVGRVLTQKQWELGHTCASYAFLSPHISLLASHTYCPLPSTTNVFQVNLMYSTLSWNKTTRLLTWNHYYQLISSALEINLPLITIKVPSFLISFNSLLSTWLSFTLYLRFINFH